MRILSLIALNILLVTSTTAQDTAESLTDEFSRLSAKARTRLAKKEAAQATADAQFQNLMLRADSLFQIGEYYSSLDVYEEARKRRPLNVHPKVKIQDLQALIESEERMNGELADKEHELPLISSDLNATLGMEHSPETVVDGSIPFQDAEVVELSSKKDGPTLEIIQVSKPDLTSPSTHPTAIKDLAKKQMEDNGPSKSTIEALELEPKGLNSQKQEAKSIGSNSSTNQIIDLEDSVEKETYKEANAVVSKLTVVSGGNADVYKKVCHQWGSIFYFKNGLAITERMWKDETLSFY